MAIFIL